AAIWMARRVHSHGRAWCGMARHLVICGPATIGARSESKQAQSHVAQFARASVLAAGGWHGTWRCRAWSHALPQSTLFESRARAHARAARKNFVDSRVMLGAWILFLGLDRRSLRPRKSAAHSFVHSANDSSAAAFAHNRNHFLGRRSGFFFLGHVHRGWLHRHFSASQRARLSAR